MDAPRNANSPIPVLVVLYDFRYMWKDNREISVKKGEKLWLLEKTNRDWWQVVRPSERKSFFVPAQYVELLVKWKTQNKDDAESFPGLSGDDDDSVVYENLDNLKHPINLPSLPRMCKTDSVGSKFNFKNESAKLLPEGAKQKPIPKMRTKVSVNKEMIEENTDPTRLNVYDTKCSFLQKFNVDNTDKANANDGIKQSFTGNVTKEISALPQDGNQNYCGKNTPVAVENLVYCNVPVEGNKSSAIKQKVKSSGFPNKVNIDTGKNRMKNSYNLKSKSSNTSKDPQSVSIESKTDNQSNSNLKNEKLLYNQHFSKSLEKLAEEIQFEPRKTSVSSKSSLSSTHSYNKTKPVKMMKDNVDRKPEKKGRSNDASIILDENKVQVQSRSVFSRFRRSLHHSNSFKSNNMKKNGKPTKKACELSLSWEGGLDKIQEKTDLEEKPLVTPFGLQRSRTFMFPERSPLSSRQSNKVAFGKHRLDTAYHSQRKPDEKVTLSTFKPIFNSDVSHPPCLLEPSTDKRIPQENFNKFGNLNNAKISTSVSEMLVRGGKKPTKDVKKNDFKSKSNIIEESNQENKFNKFNLEKSNKFDNKSKGFDKTDALSSENLRADNQPSLDQDDMALYTEPYCSNSESEDNLEEKSLNNTGNKSLRSHGSVESNLTVSEGTEASESDENNSLDYELERQRHFAHQPVNKRRTSLVRSGRVSSHFIFFSCIYLI